jgi:SAM-dependent methyltransferase
MHDPQPIDALANVDDELDPEPWLRMLRGMWDENPEKESRYRRLFRALGVSAGQRVLEVGCGAGGALRLLARSVPGLHLAVGVDPSRLAIRDAAQASARRPDVDHPRVEYVVVDGRDLAFPDAAFDVAFCSRVLVHAFDPRRIVGEMTRVLRPGGRLLIVEPDRDAMLSSAACDHVNRVFWSERRSINPRIGRQLYPLLHDLGLRVDRVEAQFNVSRRPPSASDVAQIERELAARDGEYWGLVDQGRLAESDLRAYARSLRQALDTGVYLRTDVELTYLATKP